MRRGDDTAFERLYTRYHRRITAYVNGMVHDHARAEDITQDVFVSALRRMRETDRALAFKPWLYEIAKNACIDQFRRARRTEEVSYDADGGLGSADYGRLVSTQAMPETSMDSKQQLDDLRGAFGGLSEAHHQILVMRELEGLSYREIGERLGMSRPSVESTLFRARRRLTEEYEELVSGARCTRIQTIIGEAGDGALGARDQRRLARHVSHCQGCRRQARMAGLHVAVTAGRPVGEKIAAFVPLPLFIRRWLGASEAVAPDAGTPLALSNAVQWSAQLGAVVDPSWFKAVATAATVAVAGIGVGTAARQDPPLVRAGDIAGVLAGAGDRRGAVDDGAAGRVGRAQRETAGSASAMATHSASAVAGPSGAPAAGASSGARTPGGSGSSASAGSAPQVAEVAASLPAAAGTAAGVVAESAAPATEGSPAVTPPRAELPVSAPAAAEVVTQAADIAAGAAGKTSGEVQAAAGSSWSRLGSALAGD